MLDRESYGIMHPKNNTQATVMATLGTLFPAVGVTSDVPKYIVFVAGARLCATWACVCLLPFAQLERSCDRISFHSRAETPWCAAGPQSALLIATL